MMTRWSSSLTRKAFAVVVRIPAKGTPSYGIDGPYHTYDSDLMTNYEIGTKTTWAGGRFQFNITGYHMIWEDIQIEAVDPTANTFYTAGIVNFTEAEINGFEADFSWIPAANWQTRRRAWL